MEILAIVIVIALACYMQKIVEEGKQERQERLEEERRERERQKRLEREMQERQEAKRQEQLEKEEKRRQKERERQEKEERKERERQEREERKEREKQEKEEKQKNYQNLKQFYKQCLNEHLLAENSEDNKEKMLRIAQNFEFLNENVDDVITKIYTIEDIKNIIFSNYYFIKIIKEIIKYKIKYKNAKNAKDAKMLNSLTLYI